MTKPTHVLVVGATGSIGRLAVDEAIRQGYAVRALVRNPLQTRFDPRAEVFQGDLTNVASLREALVDIDGVVFTMGAYDGPCMVEKVDYGAVRNTLLALNGRKARIALMTAIGVTYMDTDYNAPRKPTIGSDVRNAWYESAATNTPLCAPDGSTTTIQTSNSLYSCRATPIETPAPPMVWCLASKSPKCWSARSAVKPPTIKPWN